MHYGYNACSPVFPSVAISIRTLLAYQQMHRVCLWLSIQAEVRKLCYLHVVGPSSHRCQSSVNFHSQIPYQNYLANQFTIAYDLYLEVLHKVNLQVNVALGRTAPNWCLQNSCPACMYELEGEPELPASFQCEFDGNNSLKRTNEFVHNAVARPDTQTWHTDYWFLPHEVDVFKDEVRSWQVSLNRSTFLLY